MEDTSGFPFEIIQPADKEKSGLATKENPINLVDKDANKDEKKRKKSTSPAWEHFTLVPNCAEGMEKAICNYCKTKVSCNTRANGTSSMLGHLKHDFANVKCLIQFLKIFYEVTIKISGSKYCTSNLFFIELVKIQEAIVELSLSGDFLTREMAIRMKEKYDKYWDNTDNTNFLLYVSVVLDPRYKMHYVNFCFGNLYGSESPKCLLMCEKIMKTLKELFDHYKIQYGVVSSSTTSPNVGTSNNIDFRRYMEEQVQGGKGKSEIDVYLTDGIEMEDENFDILTWWKIHSTKFPVLSKIARHVLGMPISTVASESTFSTGGRTLDAYRSRLLPRTAEALICTQDWLRNVETFVDLRQEPEDYKKYETIEKDEFKDVQKLFDECVIDE